MDARQARLLQQQLNNVRRQQQRRKSMRWTLQVQHINEDDVCLSKRTDPSAVTHSIGIGKSLTIIQSPHGSEELVV